MNINSRIIEYYWDKGAWYYEVLEDGNTVEDSQKIFSKVNAEDFTKEQEQELLDALHYEYPFYTIVGK